MSNREKRDRFSGHGDAGIAPPFPLPCGVFDFGSPLGSPPRRLSVERRDGAIMPLAPLTLTDGEGLRGVILSLMIRFTPDELKWLIIDFTDSCALFNQSVYGVCDIVSGELAPLALASVDEEGARRMDGENNSPNILLVICGNEPSDVEGLWLSAERLSRYAAARVYTLISPSSVWLPQGYDTVLGSDMPAFAERDTKRITAPFRRGNI